MRQENRTPLLERLLPMYATRSRIWSTNLGQCVRLTEGSGLRALAGQNCWVLGYEPRAWKIPWMEEPGRLQSMGSLRVGQD